jgi:hypothetical protein
MARIITSDIWLQPLHHGAVRTGPVFNPRRIVKPNFKKCSMTINYANTSHGNWFARFRFLSRMRC